MLQWTSCFFCSCASIMLSNISEFSHFKISFARCIERSTDRYIKFSFKPIMHFNAQCESHAQHASRLDAFEYTKLHSRVSYLNAHKVLEGSREYSYI